MFVRRKVTSKGVTSIQIVESRRQGKKVRQRVVEHVGSDTDEVRIAGLELWARQRIAELDGTIGQMELFTPAEYERLAIQVRTQPRPDFDLRVTDYREDARLALGLREVMGKMYSLLGWDRLLGSRRMSSNRIVKALVMARLIKPQSKRATVGSGASGIGITLDLNRVYQSMDFIDAEVIEGICNTALGAMEKATGQAKVVYFDCTTLAFASEVEDGLRSKGFSKDGKPQKVQVVLALMIGPNGLPIGYDLFRGNTFEGDTLRKATERLREQYDIGDITVVADAGLLSAANRKMLREQNLSCILGYRMRNAPRKVKEAFHSEDGWEDMVLPTGEIGGRRKVIRHDGARIIVTWSRRRAAKDARNRDKEIEKTLRTLTPGAGPAKLTPRRHSRFLSFSAGGEAWMDEDKIEKERKWDGLRAIITEGAAADLAPAVALDRYHDLWQIEACFRINKHDLKIRPIFHWSERRVRAHIAICFMSFCCLQHLRHRLDLIGHSMSAEKVLDELAKLTITIHRHIDGDDCKADFDNYVTVAKVSKEAKSILRCVGLDWDTKPFTLSTSNMHGDANGQRPMAG